MSVIWWSSGDSNPGPPHCERDLVGSTNYYTFLVSTLNSTKQPSERCLQSIDSYTIPPISLQSRQPHAKFSRRVHRDRAERSVWRVHCSSSHLFAKPRRRGKLLGLFARFEFNFRNHQATQLLLIDIRLNTLSMPLECGGPSPVADPRSPARAS